MIHSMDGLEGADERQSDDRSNKGGSIRRVEDKWSPTAPQDRRNGPRPPLFGRVKQRDNIPRFPQFWSLKKLDNIPRNFGVSVFKYGSEFEKGASFDRACVT